MCGGDHPAYLCPHWEDAMDFASRHVDFKQWWRQACYDRGVSINVLHFAIIAKETCMEATPANVKAEEILLHKLWDEDEAMAAALACQEQEMLVVDVEIPAEEDEDTERSDHASSSSSSAPATTTQPPAPALRPGESPFGSSKPQAPDKPVEVTRPAVSPFATVAPAAPSPASAPATPSLEQPVLGLQQEGEAGAVQGEASSKAAPRSILAPSAGGSAVERPSSKGIRRTRFTKDNSTDKK